MTLARSARLEQCTIAQLAAEVEQLSIGRLNANVIGDSQTLIDSIAPLDTAGARQLSFLANARYRAQAAASHAEAIVLTAAEHQLLLPLNQQNRCWILSDAPYAWFTLAAQRLYAVAPIQPGVHAQASVNAAAQVSSTARVDPWAVIEAGAVVSDSAWIGSGAYLGTNSVVDAGVVLHPGVKVMAQCQIGARTVIHAGAVIGADGFGFAPLDDRWLKIPQVGRVLVGTDVEIGANTTIDRGTMGDTVIEDGVKMDNQIQIGHNCRIGAHTVIAGCVGIAGSATIGRFCQLGGAAMVLGHLSIADRCVISAGTLVSRTIDQPGFYTGFFPMMKNSDWERSAAVLRHLDELRNRVRQLEAQLPRKNTP
jgi:UDP-3-O-[3-hydroxymyristoyl] glucosamine N-acyltransferase